jgi:hypothetical protein
MNNNVFGKINLKEEDLSSGQINIGKQINDYTNNIENYLKASIKLNSPSGISDNLVRIIGYYERMGSFITDLEYEYTKLIDEGDDKFNKEWVKLNDTGMSAAACSKRAELVYDLEWRKKRRIAKWLLEKTKYLYNSVEEMVQAMKKRIDALRDEFRLPQA